MLPAGRNSRPATSAEAPRTCWRYSELRKMAPTMPPVITGHHRRGRHQGPDLPGGRRDERRGDLALDDGERGEQERGDGGPATVWVEVQPWVAAYSMA